MLKIAELKAAAQVIENEEINSDNLEDNIARCHTAWAAYYVEYNKAMALKAEYEAMNDEDGNGICNAGDTFCNGSDIVYISVEYWRCAIDTVQMLRDCNCG